LHELLEQLAVMRSSSEGQLSALFDAIPTASLREAMLVVVSTRPINLVEEAERSARLSGAVGRGLAGRVMQLDASRGDLADLVVFGGEEPGADAGARPAWFATASARDGSSSTRDRFAPARQTKEAAPSRAAESPGGNGRRR
ncbi:MAG TPA: hypothetical protein VGY53_13535, partial [Isosphaeraceae bacterium]|nr:hypothetical protein [Isosphaeraceae bacterium]